MKKIVVVGGGVGAKGFAGAALTLHKNVEVTMIRTNARGPVPCGIPYAFGTLDDPNMNVSPDKALIDKGLNLVIDKVTNINKEEKNITLDSGKTVEYDKLVIATGSLPVFPPFAGRDLDGVLTLEKDLDHVVELRNKIDNAKSIVIIGGGFIGVEMADEINKLGGKNITLVELAPTILNVAFESEFSETIEKTLINDGINVLTGVAVESFSGNGKLEKVILNNGESIDADLAFLSIGAFPNTKLAQDAGLTVERDGVIVNEYQKTSDDSIFAIGDCASKKDLFTDNYSKVRLASIASKEGRNAAYNLLEDKKILEPVGVCNLFSTAVAEVHYAAAGMTKAQCEASGFEVVAVEFTAADKHPASLPGTKQIVGKAFFEKDSLMLLGAQLSGNTVVAEIINVFGIVIQNKQTAYDLYAYNYATQPMGTSSPNAYVLHQAGLKAIKTQF